MHGPHAASPLQHVMRNGDDSRDGNADGNDDAIAMQCRGWKCIVIWMLRVLELLVPWGFGFALGLGFCVGEGVAMVQEGPAGTYAIRCEETISLSISRGLCLIASLYYSCLCRVFPT
mgnify:CR=1 FL=1